MTDHSKTVTGHIYEFYIKFRLQRLPFGAIRYLHSPQFESTAYVRNAINDFTHRESASDD